jgi:hypothetical protein
MDMELLNRAIPYKLMPLPHRAKDRSEKLEPSDIKSNTEKLDPRRMAE